MLVAAVAALVVQVMVVEVLVVLGEEVVAESAILPIMVLLLFPEPQILAVAGVVQDQEHFLRLVLVVVLES
jgi:hypothetical protein